MNTDTTLMVKSDMPNLRLELRDANLLYVADQKLSHDVMKITLHARLISLPDLIGFEIKPIFKKP